MRRDLGDFQTPLDLVTFVLDTLGPIGSRWARVLEPTCGRGHFLDALLKHSSPPREIHAIEIQPAHYRAALEVAELHRNLPTEVTITRGDVFQIDLGLDLAWRQDGPLLVVGNPPWVTNSELGSLASSHVPPKSNIKGLAGLAARTGASNFDVAEAIWLKIARDLAHESPTIALLCKTSVARGILQFARRAELPIAAATIRRIDARRWFGAAVDACWFQTTLTNQRGNARVVICGEIPVYPGLEADQPTRVMGFFRDRLIADREAHRRHEFADGVFPGTWRQGLKHDAAAVMELAVDEDSRRLRDRSGEAVDVEAEFVYPLIKGADLRRLPADRPRRAVLVTQRKIGEDTTRLAYEAPRLWAYLGANAERFERRKSSIYRGQPPFALFGIGPYSFAPFKVAISGLHKVPVFRALGPVQGRPVMLDDTCYFLACSSAEEAAAWAAICNDPITLDLIRSSCFPDAKRPITKALLQRVDSRAILGRTDRSELMTRARTIVTHELAASSDGLLSWDTAGIEEAFSIMSRAPIIDPDSSPHARRARSPVSPETVPGL